jgi:hypothetical protein
MNTGVRPDHTTTYPEFKKEMWDNFLKLLAAEMTKKFSNPWSGNFCFIESTKALASEADLRAASKALMYSPVAMRT